MNINWISVTDRLPDRDIDVLVYDEMDGFVVGYIGGYSFAQYWKICTGNSANVTHWMSLPDKPKVI
jgi:hypothetical protein